MSTATDDVRVGGWILSLYKAISYYDVDDAIFDDYEAIVTAAKSGELLSSIRALGIIEARRYDIYRRMARLKPTQAQQVLVHLEKLSAVHIRWDPADPTSVATILALKTDKADVLATTAQIFEQCRPSATARAAL